MKKYLLGTAAAAALFGSAAVAGNPTPTASAPALTMSGQAAFNLWFNNNKVRDNGNDHYGQNALATVNDARLKVSVDGKTDPGMDYGFVTVFDLETNKEKNIREAYMYFGGSWGTTYLGDADGVEKTMAFGGFDPLVGTGGFDGNHDEVVNFTNFTVHSTDLNGTTKRSTKLTYITPRWRGLQFGVSYTPKHKHGGNQTQNTFGGNVSGEDILAPDSIESRNNVAFGGNFTHTFGNGFEFGLSGTAVFAKGLRFDEMIPVNGNNKFRNVRSYAIGTLMKFKGFDFGFEYGNNGKGGMPRSALIPAKTNQGQFVDFGLGYTWGCTKIAAGYYYGWRTAATSAITTAKSKTNIWTAGVEHKLAAGLAAYFEWARYHMKNPGAAYGVTAINTALNNAGSSTVINNVPNNTANSFVLGTKIKF